MPPLDGSPLCCVGRLVPGVLVDDGLAGVQEQQY